MPERQFTLVDGSGCIAQRLLDIVHAELRKLAEDLVSAHPFGHHANDRGDGDPGPLDARNATHDQVVDGDPLKAHMPIVTVKIAVARPLGSRLSCLGSLAWKVTDGLVVTSFRGGQRVSVGPLE